MFAITLVAVGAALAAWLRPIPEPKSAGPISPTFTEPQISEAKAAACEANGKVRRALAANASRNGGDDPTAQLAVAVNARQVYVAGSAHLLTALADRPATPSDLAVATRKLADIFQLLTLDGLSGEPNEQGHDAADRTLETIQNLCK